MGRPVVPKSEGHFEEKKIGRNLVLIIKNKGWVAQRGRQTALNKPGFMTHQAALKGKMCGVILCFQEEAVRSVTEAVSALDT